MDKQAEGGAGRLLLMLPWKQGVPDTQRARQQLFPFIGFTLLCVVTLMSVSTEARNKCLIPQLAVQSLGVSCLMWVMGLELTNQPCLIKGSSCDSWRETVTGDGVPG